MFNVLQAVLPVVSRSACLTACTHTSVIFFTQACEHNHFQSAWCDSCRMLIMKREKRLEGRSTAVLTHRGQSS